MERADVAANMKRPEEALHRAVAHFLRVALPPEAVWHHSPNGGGRSKAEAGIFKAMGTRPGWPDIEVVYCGFVYFIELKAPGGRLSANQKTCHTSLRGAGTHIAICHRVEEVEGTLRGWGVPLKATTGQAA